MALIGKIRKNFWLVLVLLALALASFVIQSAISDKASRGRGGSLFSSSSNVGVINGEKIDIRDFEKTEKILYGGSTDVYGRRQQLWSYLVEKGLVEKQAKALGLGVSKEELMELQFGNRLSSVVQNNFGNPQTGQVDRQRLLQFKQAFESGQDMNPEFRAFWGEQEKQIIKTAVQDKINALVSKSMIVPKWQAEVMNGINNDKVNFEFVKVGFDKVADTEIKLTDDDYKNFLAKNPLKYDIPEETRMLDYASFNVNPTLADSNKIKADLLKIKANFRVATNDSLFAASNGGMVTNGFTKVADLTGPLKDSISSMAIGRVMGPYIENGNYVLAKLLDKRVLADSVKARHILRSASSPADVAKAKREIDSLKNLIVSGRSRFDSLAMRNSQDPGSGAKGGDLGTFAQGTMVKQFNDACFLTGKPGGIYTVTTQFGVHLIEVQNQKFVDKSPKYSLAYIPAAISPSQETQDAAFDKVSGILSKTKSLDDLKKAAEKNPEIVLTTTRSMKENDYNIQGFTGSDVSRSMIKWAFNNDVNTVSPEVYEFKDERTATTKNYVLAGVSAINKAGLMSVAEAKKVLEMQVKNAKKGEMLKAKLTSSDLRAIATQFGTNVDTALNATLANGFIDAIQASEPLVVAKAFKLGAGKTSKAIVGNTGVYMIKVLDVVPALKENSNLDMVKTAIASSAKQSASYRIWEALKKRFKPTDNRSAFF